MSVATEACLREVAALDLVYGADLKALETLLLRTESVASSKIEWIEASVDDFARALHGIDRMRQRHRWSRQLTRWWP